MVSVLLKNTQKGNKISAVKPPDNKHNGNEDLYCQNMVELGPSEKTFNGQPLEIRGSV